MTEGKFPIDADAVRELAGLLDETGLSEIEIEDSGRRLRVARPGAALASASVLTPAPAPASGPETSAASGPGEGDRPGAVKSPMVGTVYLSPEPGSAPFVKVGDAVSEGDTLLVIEAMKVMNAIRAPHGGAVARVLVENGGPVEFGQVLMVID